jgi:hypothetical protein
LRYSTIHYCYTLIHHQKKSLLTREYLTSLIHTKLWQIKDISM